MILPKELRQVIKMSGGKVILSEGDVRSSYVVMKLSEYLKEKRKIQEGSHEDFDQEDEFEEDDEYFDSEEDDFEQDEEALDKEDEKKFQNPSLTKEELLDRINADVRRLQQREAEQELEQQFEIESEISEKEKDYSYESLQG